MTPMGRRTLHKRSNKDDTVSDTGSNIGDTLNFARPGDGHGRADTSSSIKLAKPSQKSRQLAQQEDKKKQDQVVHHFKQHDEKSKLINSLKTSLH